MRTGDKLPLGRVPRIPRVAAIRDQPKVRNRAEPLLVLGPLVRLLNAVRSKNFDVDSSDEPRGNSERKLATDMNGERRSFPDQPQPDHDAQVARAWERGAARVSTWFGKN